jgi:outer membrane translocation and assembly module TamA
MPQPLTSSENPGFDDMRHAIGGCYRLPIGPIRLDYGYNQTGAGEDNGAFHFSFGFAF